jgi:hypothetical protein
MPKQKNYVMLQDESYVAYAQKLIQRVLNGEVLTEEDMTVQ